MKQVVGETEVKTSSKFSRRLSYVALNVMIVLALYFGVYYGNVNAARVFRFFVWLGITFIS